MIDVTRGITSIPTKNPVVPGTWAGEKRRGGAFLADFHMAALSNSEIFINLRRVQSISAIFVVYRNMLKLHAISFVSNDFRTLIKYPVDIIT